MSLDSKVLEDVLKNLNPKIFEESEQDKYFREKLNRLSKLSMSSYEDLMQRYVMKATSFGLVDMNEFDKEIDELLKEDKNMPLAKNERLVYKKNVSTNKFVKVGVVDNCGFIDFYDTDKKVDLSSLSFYHPEFYIDVEIPKVTMKEVPRLNDLGERVGSKYESVGTYISSIDRRVFTPKNLPQQTISLVGSVLLKPEEYYVTGYVTKEGKVYYYDQYLE